MCETRDLVIKWSHWHTLVFNDETRIDMRCVCPKDVKKILVQRARPVSWKKWAAKHEQEEPKEGARIKAALALLRKTAKGVWTEKHRNVVRKIFWVRLDAKETVRCWPVGGKSMSSLPDGGRHRKAQALPCPEWHEERRHFPEPFKK